ncbi:flippase [Geminocystis herdmanii]|uniref:flippase n=1 Tax=Geminocystis herdmanii TaxID=669359 RepID=UPI000346B939|nr:flippase [Geminocystis herdmanii]
MNYKNIVEKLKHLKNNPELLKIVGNTGWLFFDRILRMGMGLLIGVWVARYLGVEQFGIFNYALAFVILFISISTLGLPSLVVRTITENPEDKDTILGTTFWLQIGGGIASLIISVLTIFLLKPDDYLTIYLVAILGSMGIFRAFETIDLWFQSQVRSKYTVLAKNTAFIIAGILKIILIYLNASLIAFAWATLAEFIIAGIGLIIVYESQGYSLKLWRWSLSLAKKLLKESWPLILSGLTVMIYMKMDQIMLGFMIDANAVGLYSSATKISEAWYFIPTAIVSSVSPSIYQAKKDGDEALYYEKITKVLKFLNIVAISISIPMTILSKPLILLLFGQEFSPAGTILAIHIWTSVFVFMGQGTFPWFIAEGLNDLSFRRTFLGAISNVILNLLLIPLYAGIGAAIATIISQAIASFLSNATHPKTRKIFKVQLRSMF